MNTQDRKKIGHLIRALELFTKKSCTIPLHQVIAFLYVARTPGMGVTEVANASQTNLGSTSRHIKALRVQRGATPPLLAAAYGKDERTKPLLLTEDGQRLIADVLVALEAAAMGPATVDSTANEPPGRNQWNDPVRGARNQVAWDPFGAT